MLHVTQPQHHMATADIVHATTHMQSTPIYNMPETNTPAANMMHATHLHPTWCMRHTCSQHSACNTPAVNTVHAMQEILFVFLVNDTTTDQLSLQSLPQLIFVSRWLVSLDILVICRGLRACPIGGRPTNAGEPNYFKCNRAFQQIL